MSIRFSTHQGDNTMTATLWIDSDNDETIELGGSFTLYKCFKELCDTAGGFSTFAKDYPDLSGIITQIESGDDADKKWLLDVVDQANKFLRTYGNNLNHDTRYLLTQLVEHKE